MDEVGYLTYDNRAADLLFQVVSRRYERRSLLLTTNLAFKDWGTIFPNAACRYGRPPPRRCEPGWRSGDRGGGPNCSSMRAANP